MCWMLPHLALNFDRAPEELQQRLFELTKLRVEVRYPTHEATFVITLPRGLDDGFHGGHRAATADRAPRRPAIAAKPQVEASA